MKNKDKQNKSIEDLTYDILGNAFVGNLFDISNDIDNTSQNLIAYLELEDIKKLSKKQSQDEGFELCSQCVYVCPKTQNYIK